MSKYVGGYPNGTIESGNEKITGLDDNGISKNYNISEIAGFGNLKLVDFVYEATIPGTNDVLGIDDNGDPVKYTVDDLLSSVASFQLSDFTNSNIVNGTEKLLADNDNVAVKYTINDLMAYHAANGPISHEALSVFQDGLLEPTGFPNLGNDSDIAFDNATRTFTISPKTSEFVIFQKAIKHNFTTSQSIQIADVSGIHVIYFDNGILVDQYVMDIHDVYNIIEGKVIVAYVGWRADLQEEVYFANERHGSQMDSLTHRYLHFTFGTQYVGGAGLADFDVDGDGDIDSSAQFSISFGTAFDEDITFHGLPIASTVGLPIYYLTDNGITRTTNVGFSALTTGSGRLAFNEYNGTSHVLSEVPNRDCALIHIFLTNDVNNPYIARIGNTSYSNKSRAREGALTEVSTLLTNATIFQESVAIASIIFQTNDNYNNGIKSIIISTGEGDDYIDWRGAKLSAGSTSSDHGNLGGLGDDDHKQYLLSNLNIITDTTTNRILSLDDARKYITFTNIGAITVTIPPESDVNFIIGSIVEFEQNNTGTITFVGGIGVTINSFDNSYDSAGQFATISIKKVASDVWTLNGLLV